MKTISTCFYAQNADTNNIYKRKSTRHSTSPSKFSIGQDERCDQSPRVQPQAKPAGDFFYPHGSGAPEVPEAVAQIWSEKTTEFETFDILNLIILLSGFA